VRKINELAQVWYQVPVNLTMLSSVLRSLRADGHVGEGAASPRCPDERLPLSLSEVAVAVAPVTVSLSLSLSSRRLPLSLSEIAVAPWRR